MDENDVSCISAGNCNLRPSKYGHIMRSRGGRCSSMVGLLVHDKNDHIRREVACQRDRLTAGLLLSWFWFDCGCTTWRIDSRTGSVSTSVKAKASIKTGWESNSVWTQPEPLDHKLTPFHASAVLRFDTNHVPLNEVLQLEHDLLACQYCSLWPRLECLLARCHSSLHFLLGCLWHTSDHLIGGLKGGEATQF